MRLLPLNAFVACCRVTFTFYPYCLLQFVIDFDASFSGTKCNCAAYLFSEHISYIRNLIGVHHIGVGGDFDGINR